MGKVLDFISHADAVKAVPLKTKVEVYQRITREWAKHLTASETMVLFAVADRTVGWGRREAYFTVKAMVKGDAIYAPLPMSRATVFRALASLQEKGFVNRRHVRDAANHEHPKVHFSVNINWKPGMVRLPRRLQATKSASHCETTGSHGETAGSHSDTLYTVSPIPVSHNDSRVPGILPRPIMEGEILFPGKKEGRPQPQTPSPPARRRASLANPAEVIQERLATNSPMGGTQQGAGLPLDEKYFPQRTSEQVQQAWRVAIIETFPGNIVPLWTARENAQAKQAAKRWIGRRVITFPDFVTWCVTNWTAIMRKQFKWMKKSPPPAVPAWGFFIYHIDQFAECRAEGKLEEWLSDADRTEIERVMARGVTWEQAVAQLAEAKAKGVLRGEMQRVAIEASAKLRAADVVMKRAQKLADYAGNAPVRPRSRAAMRMRREAAEADAARKPTIIVDPSPGDFQGVTGVPMLPERNPFDEPDPALRYANGWRMALVSRPAC